MKKDCIVIDLDGTLANVKHRQEKLLSENNWKNFNSKMTFDKLNFWCYELIELFRCKYNIIIVTGRSEEFLTTTKKWLADNKVFYNEIFFRKKNDYRDDRIVKKEIFEQYIKPIYKTLFVIDDRDKVVQMWRELGLTCLQCDFGDF